jgi:hypothetical protein
VSFIFLFTELNPFLFRVVDTVLFKIVLTSILKPKLKIITQLHCYYDYYCLSFCSWCLPVVPLPFGTGFIIVSTFVMRSVSECQTLGSI